MEDEEVQCKDLLCYLQDLPSATLGNLYGFSAACLAVFRELPELSKLYVMRLLFLEQPLTLTFIDSWIQPGASNLSAHREAMAKLQNLRVVEMTPIAGGQQGVSLNANFSTNLRVLLCGGGSPWALVGHRGGEDKHARDTTFLNDYADRQWEAVLNYMVGGGEQGAEEEVKNILKYANLMASSASDGKMAITNRGFQFLLMDRSSQVWYFMMNHLQLVVERGMNLLECLTFLFQLSFSTLGKYTCFPDLIHRQPGMADYSKEGMTASQEGLMQQLRQFGLVYQRKRSSKRYYPTKLAINLVSGAGSHSVPAQRSGFVVVETNFRVMAYTDSQLKIAILGLFCHLQYRFPNVVVGTISRESIHQALINGITAEQILGYLRLHAHDQMLKNNPIIPPTVSDQIRLWEIERNRLQMEDGVLYSEFMSANDFDTVRRYAEDLGVLLWSNPGKRLMVVTPSGHDEVRRFWRRQKNS